jgi:hypothetical protein
MSATHAAPLKPATAPQHFRRWLGCRGWQGCGGRLDACWQGVDGWVPDPNGGATLRALHPHRPQRYEKW